MASTLTLIQSKSVIDQLTDKKNFDLHHKLGVRPFLFIVHEDGRHHSFKIRTIARDEYEARRKASELVPNTTAL